jgi:hypothetical protein
VVKNKNIIFFLRKFIFYIFFLTILFNFIKINISFSDAWLIKPTEGEEKLYEIENIIIQSTIKAKIKYINFSDSNEYDHERKIVYEITNMKESEYYSEGSMKKAIIRIAMEDLNDDGTKEILAYIIQFAWCGKGGGYCTFIIFQRKGEKDWKEIFNLSTYPDIGIAESKNKGYHDIVFRNMTFIVEGEKILRNWQELVIWRWDGKKYKPYMKGEAVYNQETKKDKITIMDWDEGISYWKEIKVIYL